MEDAMSVETDRELLELAAKAAGHKIKDWWEKYPGEWWMELLVARVPGDPPTVWNPLRDDGDALRLGAALRLHILHNDPDDSVLWVSAVLNKRGLHGVVEFQDEGQRADATRRAIVLAAAEIGRAIP